MSDAFTPPHRRGPPGATTRRDYLLEFAPIRLLINYFNRVHPGEASLQTSTVVVAGLEGEVYEAQWHQWMNLKKIRGAQDIDELRRILAEWHVRYLLAPTADSELAEAPPLLQTLTKDCSEPELVAHDMALRRLTPGCRGTGSPPVR